MSIKILVGDALEQLRELPDESVHCVVTSPPYWGLRAYGGDAGMIGLEPTFDDHLANLVAVFCEVRRVLRGDGTLWLNYGDAYARGDRWDTGCQEGLGGRGGRIGEPLGLPRRSGYKPKDLMMMPSRVAMALQADGWWLRSEIVWQKKNPMPESVTDRPTSAHEKVFLLSKRAKYFYDAEAVRVPWMGAVKTPRYMGRHKHVIPDDKAVKSGPDVPDDFGALISRGSNLRNVWSIATFAYPGSHFATFPPALVEPCIKAGTSAKGVCGECGAPWVRTVAKRKPPESLFGVARDADGMVRKNSSGGVKRTSGSKLQRFLDDNPPTTTGWQPTCEHAAEVRQATVLDPFAGSGTVGLVADRLGRDAILIELNPEYAAMAEQRIVRENPLFCKVEVKG